jgi:hypothetical protein
MAETVEQFLARGGHIQKIPQGVSTETAATRRLTPQIRRDRVSPHRGTPPTLVTLAYHSKRNTCPANNR